MVCYISYDIPASSKDVYKWPLHSQIGYNNIQYCLASCCGYFHQNILGIVIVNVCFNMIRY